MMDANKFMTEWQRLCRAHNEVPCSDCPVCENCVDAASVFLTEVDVDALVGAVEKWSKDHPAKALVQDFFEKYPKSKKLENGYPDFCPQKLGYEVDCNAMSSCVECWNQPVEGNEHD